MTTVHGGADVLNVTAVGNFQVKTIKKFQSQPGGEIDDGQGDDFIDDNDDGDVDNVRNVVNSGSPSNDSGFAAGSFRSLDDKEDFDQVEFNTLKAKAVVLWFSNRHLEQTKRFRINIEI